VAKDRFQVGSDFFPKASYDYQLILTHILEHAAKMCPRGEIVYRNILRGNYARLYERCQRVSSALRKLGVQEHTRVVAFEWNTHRFLEIYFAVPCMGAILHLGNPLLAPEQIAYAINHAEDEVVILSKDFIPLMESISDKLQTVRHYIVLTDDGKVPETRLNPIVEYEELLGTASPDYIYPELNENTVATICYTTGTTGDPKGAYFTHRQAVIHTLAWANFFQGFLGERGIDPRRDFFIHLVPMFHAHSWGIPYIATLLGMKQVFPGRFSPEVFLELLKQERKANEGVYAASVATMLNAICSHSEVERYRNYLKGMTYIVGGGALPKGLALRARELGMETVGAWGMTETFPIMGVSYLKPHMFDWPEEKKTDFLIRTGLPFALVEQRVVDAEGRDVPKDDQAYGEILLRAPWLTGGYIKEPEKSKELWRDGWLHTGDIATVDEENSLLIVDRAKDVIKSGGEWISTLILESLLSTHPKVQEVAVVAAKSAKWGERPIAVVVPKQEYKEDLAEDELREYMMQYVGEGKILKWWIPEKFIFTEEIPRTSTGKFNKRALRSKYWDALDG